jgi:hypothetical protein
MLRRHTLRVGETRAAAPVGKTTATPSSITIGIDSTFIRSCNAAEQRQLQVYVGNIESDCGTRHVFGAVAGGHPSIQTALKRALEAAGRVEGGTVTAFSHGDPFLRNVLRSSGIGEKPILHWFHIGMRLQHLTQAAQGLPARLPWQRRAQELIAAEIERLRWRLWHGKAKNARKAIDAIRGGMHAYKGERRRRKPSTSRRVWSTLFEIDRYVSGQSGWTINYAARHRTGLRVGTALAEGGRQLLREPAHEQSPADEIVDPRRQSPPAGALRRLQRHA